MKYIAAGLVIMIGASCEKMQETTIENETKDFVYDGYGVPMSFKAKGQDVMKSDINVGASAVVWDSDDAIAIYDGSALREFTVSSRTNGNKIATFSGSAAEVGTYYSVSPFSAATLDTDIKVNLPSTQTVIADHCVDGEAMVATATVASGADISFTNQFSLLKINLSSSDIVSVTLAGKGDEAICGEKVLSTSDGSFSGTPEGKTINLVYKATKEGAYAAFPAGDYFIVLWPTEFTEGFKLIMTKSDGSKAVKSTSSDVTFALNSGANASTINDVTFVPPVITTASQLKMWRRVAEYYAEGEEVKLGADINLEGYAWEPVSSYFGIFDGQNHKIYNFTINSDASRVGFISTLGNADNAATLKDVVFGSSNGTSADGASSINATGANSQYVAVVGYVRNSTVSGVKNFMPVTASADVNRSHAIAGIVGSVNSNGLVENCINNAAITDNSTYANFAGSAIGGIVGQINGSNSQIYGSTNNGDVINYCPDVCYVGGIVGLGGVGQSGNVIENCLNTATVNNAAASLQHISDGTCKLGDGVEWQIGVGGIVGVMGNMSIIKCSNEGVINQSKKVVEGSAYTALGKETDTRPALGGIAGVACRSGATIKGCTNSNNVRYISEDQDSAAMGGILGVAVNSGKTCSVLITKADDGTRTTNSGKLSEQDSGGVATSYSMYIGGIVGLGASSNLTVSYCDNSGNIRSKQSQNAGNFRFGGIMGTAEGASIDNCTNSGYIQAHGGGTSVGAQVGGICGGPNGQDAAAVTNCVNTGTVGIYKAKNDSYAGGILACWTTNKTTVTNCINKGLITAGNMNSYPTYRSVQTNQNIYYGGLFGKVHNNSAQTKNVTGCYVACDMLVRSGNLKYKGIIFGKLNGSSKAVTIGTSESPVGIVNTTTVTYGTDANPSVNTVNSITSLNEAYPFLSGDTSSFYSSSSPGSTDESMLKYYLQIVTPATAGIE